jgi:hypothetical protein
LKLVHDTTICDRSILWLKLHASLLLFFSGYEVSCEPEGILTENSSGNLGERRQGVSPASSSSDMRPPISLSGSDISALHAGLSRPVKLSDTSAIAGHADNTVFKAVPGQPGLRRAPHNSLGPRGARLRPLTVGQVLAPRQLHTVKVQTCHVTNISKSQVSGQSGEALSSEWSTSCDGSEALVYSSVLDWTF